MKAKKLSLSNFSASFLAYAYLRVIEFIVSILLLTATFYLIRSNPVPIDWRSDSYLVVGFKEGVFVTGVFYFVLGYLPASFVAMTLLTMTRLFSLGALQFENAVFLLVFGAWRFVSTRHGLPEAGLIDLFLVSGANYFLPKTLPSRVREVLFQIR